MVDFIKKYKIYILLAFTFIMFVRSCSKSRSISKLEKNQESNISKLDSLESLVNLQKHKLDSIPDILRKEKLSIYLYLDDTISRVDRTPQLMGFHKIIKDEIKDLQK